MSDNNQFTTIPEATASQETLVNPPRNIVFRIYKLDPMIGSGFRFTLNRQPRYDICMKSRTESKEICITDPRSNELLVKIKRYKLASTKIKFYKYNNGMVIKVKKDWFTHQNLDDGRRTWSFKIGEEKYIWILGEYPQARWALYHVSDLNASIAWMQAPTDANLDVVPHAFISISPGFEPFCDLIVAGWTYVEELIRVEQVFRQRVMEIVAANLTPMVNLPGFL